MNKRGEGRGFRRPQGENLEWSYQGIIGDEQEGQDRQQEEQRPWQEAVQEHLIMGQGRPDGQEGPCDHRLRRNQWEDAEPASGVPFIEDMACYMKEDPDLETN